MDFLFLKLDKIVAVLVLITSSIGLRFLLQFMGQRWITTFAHTATLVVLPVITFVITNVISGNIALSLGMVGALSIVRFRNPVRSPLELSTYFAAITMGITASVNLLWLIFFIISILIAAASVYIVSFISNNIFSKPFFTASFSEGNTLSTLEVTSTESLPLLEESDMIKSKSLDSKEISYLLVSSNFYLLKEIADKLQDENCLISLQINSG
tara:strand:- start:2970 stop:3605 length:636 start_codon:yes stop_codon:yes gene_type:complete